MTKIKEHIAHIRTDIKEINYHYSLEVAFFNTCTRKRIKRYDRQVKSKK